MTTTSEAAAVPSHDQGNLDAAHECALIEADLERLKSLINDAGDRLLISFNRVVAVLPALGASEPQRSQVAEPVHAAVTALQFQDMATQLIGHAQRRLSLLEACLRSLSEQGVPGLRVVDPHPVRQVELTAGSIDLF